MSHEYFMQLALDEARRALAENEVPVGAVIVRSGQVVAQAHNQREQLQDPTAHAEMIAITQAAAACRSWRLEDCTLYVTLEPCPMCAGAVWAAQVGTVVFGAADLKAGATGSLYNFAVDPRLNPNTRVVHGVRAPECAEILTRFFADRRA